MHILAAYTCKHIKNKKEKKKNELSIRLDKSEKYWTNKEIENTKINEMSWNKKKNKLSRARKAKAGL